MSAKLSREDCRCDNIGGLSLVIASSISIVGSVGRGGRNQSADVSTIQTRLNELMGVSRKNLKVDGLSGPKTEGMIAEFQRSVLKFRWPDARVDRNGRTIVAMNDPNSATIWRSVPPSWPAVGKKKTIHLHFRSISLTNVSFDDRFRAAVQVYGQYNIDVRMKSGRSEILSEENRKKFKRVDTTCVAGMDEWSALQDLLNDVPPLESLFEKFGMKIKRLPGGG